MPAKRGAHNVYLSEEIYTALQAKVDALSWPWGVTKYIEKVLREHVEGKPSEDVSTEKFFLTLFALGIVDDKRLGELLRLVQSGQLPAAVQRDKFGIKFDPPRDSGKKK